MPVVIFNTIGGLCVATSSVDGNDVCGNNSSKEAANPAFDENDSIPVTQNPPRRSPSNVYRVTSLPLDAYSEAAKNRMDSQYTTQTKHDTCVSKTKIKWCTCCFTGWFDAV